MADALVYNESGNWIQLSVVYEKEIRYGFQGKLVNGRTRAKTRLDWILPQRVGVHLQPYLGAFD